MQYVFRFNNFSKFDFEIQFSHFCFNIWHTVTSNVIRRARPPDLALPVTLTGVREPNNIIVIERTAESKATQVDCYET